MIRDVFYYGKKPNVHPREKFASSFEDARQQNTTEHFWIVNEFCDYTNFDWDFDFEFLPDEDVWAKDHINIWPSKYQKDSGTWLCSENCQEIKIYRNDVDPIKRKNQINNHWVILKEIDQSLFDFGWHHDPTDPPYIYVFGNQWFPGIIMPTVEYHVEGATEYKYVYEIIAKLKKDPSLFCDTDLIESFDYSWRPNPNDPPLVYQFPTQWAKTHGPRYVVEGATEIKYMDYPIAVIKSDMSNWIVPDQIDVTEFDFSWHPDGTSPAYIYQFGTLVDDIHLEDGPRYITPGNLGDIVLLDNEKFKLKKVKYPKYYIISTLEDLIKEHPDEIFWALRPNIDYSEFNFDYIPDKENIFHINVFGSPESETTQTYLVNGKMLEKGHMDRHYVEDVKTLNDEYLSKLFLRPDIFYIDKGNPGSQERFEILKSRFKNIQKTRYLNSWVETITRCCNKSTTELCWILNSELDYTDFDFDYYPNPWQLKMVHVFGTQWSHWGTTFLVNKESFPEDTKYVKVIEHLNNLNFIKSKRAKVTRSLYDIVYINHGNVEKNELEEQGNIVVDYQDSYLETFKKVLEKLPVKKEYYVWLVSTICDYTKFDFSYICDPFAKEHLHVFPSDLQKFGDTFLVDVNKLRSLINDLDTLEDYDKINFNQHQRVTRLEPPVIISKDTHTSDISDSEFNFPYAVFLSEDNKDINVRDIEPISLWDEKTKNILVTSTGGTRIIVPKEAKKYVDTELYDYPYISKSKKLIKSKPLDIIFFSNGETNADENYKHLLEVTKNLSNRVSRIDKIQGRVNSQHAAANESQTPWYFLVNAKLRVNKDFDFDWQPDRLQIPKHYIFLATNPVNGLEYGHQAIVANNKKLTLNTEVKGLDFTMDSDHEIVGLNSGKGVYNTSEWDTWRTAFREAVKLRYNQTIENNARLDVWLNKAEGLFSEWSLLGAKDAIEFFESVNGDLEKLMSTYDWPFLHSIFIEKYK